MDDRSMSRLNQFGLAAVSTALDPQDTMPSVVDHLAKLDQKQRDELELALTEVLDVIGNMRGAD